MDISFAAFAPATKNKFFVRQSEVRQRCSCWLTADFRPVDLVLTPTEQAIVATVVTQMNAAIQGEAEARGYAFFSLDAFFRRSGRPVPLNVVTFSRRPSRSDRS